MKTCSKCKEVLELDDFATDRTKALGGHSLLYPLVPPQGGTESAAGE